jgi:hypothetical protein
VGALSKTGTIFMLCAALAFAGGAPAEGFGLLVFALLFEILLPSR